MNIVPLPSADWTTDPSVATPTSNLVLMNPGTYTIASKQINALLLGPGVTLDGLDPTSGPKTSSLYLATGNLMMDEGSVLNVGYLSAQTNMLFAADPLAAGTAACVVNSNIGNTFISNSFGTTEIVKIGGGTMVWAGANTITTTYSFTVAEGLLNVQNSDGLGSPTGAGGPPIGYVQVNPNAAIQLQASSPTGSINIGGNISFELNGTGIESQYGPATTAGPSRASKGRTPFPASSAADRARTSSRRCPTGGPTSSPATASRWPKTPSSALRSGWTPAATCNGWGKSTTPAAPAATTTTRCSSWARARWRSAGRWRPLWPAAPSPRRPSPPSRPAPWS